MLFSFSLLSCENPTSPKLDFHFPPTTANLSFRPEGRRFLPSRSGEISLQLRNSGYEFSLVRPSFSFLLSSFCLLRSAPPRIPIPELQPSNLLTDHAKSMVILSESASRRTSLFNVLRLHSNDIPIIT